MAIDNQVFTFSPLFCLGDCILHLYKAKLNKIKRIKALKRPAGLQYSHMNSENAKGRQAGVHRVTGLNYVCDRALAALRVRHTCITQQEKRGN